MGNDKLEKLREQIESIAYEEYNKLWKQYQIDKKEIEAFSILNYSEIGIQYWIAEEAAGFSFCQLHYSINSYNSNNGYFAYSMEEALDICRKSKSKMFKNPFNIVISRSFVNFGSAHEISEKHLSKMTEDIKLIKTKVIYKYR